MYTQQEQLIIYKRIGVTEEAYSVLRKQKQKTKFSMAKIISNLVLQTYGKQRSKKKNESN